MAPEIKLPLALVLLIAVQIVCAAFFLGDAIGDYRQLGPGADGQGHQIIETLATLSLCAAVVLESRYLLWLLRRKAHLEKSISIAAAAIHEVIEAQFKVWSLTPAEHDIAHFLVKGMTIAEIAQLRGSAEGTVKSHLNAIYRKSGTTGRGDLMCLILDGLINEQSIAQGPEREA